MENLGEFIMATGERVLARKLFRYHPSIELKQKIPQKHQKSPRRLQGKTVR
jgi:hypothetical protein